MNSLFGSHLEIVPYYAEKLSDLGMENERSRFRSISDAMPGRYPEYVGVVAEKGGTIDAKIAVHDAIVAGKDHRSVADHLGVRDEDRAFWVFCSVAADASSMRAQPDFVLDFCAGAVVATGKAKNRGRKHKGYMDHAAIGKVWRRYLPTMWAMWRTHGDPLTPDMVVAFEKWLALAERHGRPEKAPLHSLDRDVLRQIARLEGKWDPITMRRVTGAEITHYLPLVRWYQVFGRDPVVREEILRFPTTAEPTSSRFEPSVAEDAPVAVSVPPADAASEAGALASSPGAEPAIVEAPFPEVSVPIDIRVDEAVVGLADEREPDPSVVEAVAPSVEEDLTSRAPELPGHLTLLHGDVVLIEMECVGELPDVPKIADLVHGLVEERRPAPITIRVGRGMEAYAARLGLATARRDRGIDVVADGATLRIDPVSYGMEDFRVVRPVV